MNIWQILKYIGIILLIIILALLLWWAAINGKQAAQSRQNVKDSKAIITALEYFYNDQNRYPAISEFNDQNVMRQYISNFPPQEFSSELCERNFEYQNSFRTDYELRMCLSKGVNGYKTGWNIIKAPSK